MNEKIEVLRQLTQASEVIPNLAIKSWKEQGRKVIGLLCSYIPEELIFAAGLHVSIAGRLSSQVRSFGIIEDVTVTGGCAKNKCLVESLQKKLETTIKILPEDPQIVGALWAALLVQEKLGKQT